MNYEYKIIETYGNGELTLIANEQGELGWRLITITTLDKRYDNCFSLIFEREVK